MPDALETGWQSGVRSSVLPGLSTHLMQELKVDTVSVKYPRARLTLARG